MTRAYSRADCDECKHYEVCAMRRDILTFLEKYYHQLAEGTSVKQHPRAEFINKVAYWCDEFAEGE